MKNILLNSVLLLSTLTLYSTEKTYELKLLTGQDIKPVIGFVAQKRLDTFCEYPYLYEGTMEYERAYLENFSIPENNAAIAMAYYNQKAIGFVTAIPLIHAEIVQESLPSLENEGINTKKCFYISEGIVDQEHRKQKIALRLYGLIKKYAHEKGFTIESVLNESHEEHPLKPKNYIDINNTFIAHGAVKTITTLKAIWPTFQVDGSVKEQEHVLQYWVKNLNE